MKRDSEDDQDDQTLREYATKVLSESLVTGVPGIVKAPTWMSKGFKLGVLLISFCGFLYQSTTFMSYVLEYPSVVDVHVKTPERIPVPAYTVCNNNGIRRSKYCKKYPDNCETPKHKAEFCHAYPHYCHGKMDWDSFKVPKKEFFGYESNLTFQEIKEFGHVVNILGITETESLGNEAHSRFVDEVKNILFKGWEYAYLCNTKHFLVDSSAEMKTMPFPPYHFERVFMLAIDAEAGESFIPSRTPGILFSVHSPFDLVNPYETGYFLKEGQRYSFYYTLEETLLLPSPYGIGCTNYTLSWLNNGKRGPRSREMCVEECELKLFQSHCNDCVPKFALYPVPANACFTDGVQCQENKNIDWSICQSECKQSCHNIKFKVTARENVPQEFGASSDSPPEPQLKVIIVEIFASNEQMIVYKHRPHYQTIEIFSYVGGYIGVWLGISLVAVTDFVESVCHMSAFAYRNKKKNAERKRSF